VVDVGGAVAENSTGVEGPVGGVNADGEGGSTEGGGDGVAVAHGDVLVTIDAVRSAGGTAGSVLAGVGVRSLVGDTVVLDEVQGGSGPSTVAALVAVVSGAIDQLLLGEVLGTLSVDEGEGLEHTGGGEGPAGTAGSLVLDAGDLALRVPVDGVGGGG